MPNRKRSVRPADAQKPTEVEVQLRKLEAKKQNHSKTIRELTEALVSAKAANETLLSLKKRTPQEISIKPKTQSGTSESVCFLIASDWHSEESVEPGSVSGVNEFNLDVCKARATKFFQGGHRLYNIMARDTKIDTIVLGLLGDFITNTIHEDAQESNNLLPADAIYFVQSLIISGIKFLLANTPKSVDIVIPCHSGNHGRMTKKQRGATENGNSLECYMYHNLRDVFAGEKRVKFILAEGYHTYMTLWPGTPSEFVVRFHHGHAISYGGGVGGITIPVNKAIDQWNKTRRADLDVFGHFHQLIDAGNFVANGSLIGFNDYAVRIKAPFEKPRQAFFLVNKKYRMKTMFTPIVLG